MDSTSPSVSGALSLPLRAVEAIGESRVVQQIQIKFKEEPDYVWVDQDQFKEYINTMVRSVAAAAEKKKTNSNEIGPMPTTSLKNSLSPKLLSQTSDQQPVSRHSSSSSESSQANTSANGRSDSPEFNSSSYGPVSLQSTSPESNQAGTSSSRRSESVELIPNCRSSRPLSRRSVSAEVGEVTAVRSDATPGRYPRRSSMLTVVRQTCYTQRKASASPPRTAKKMKKRPTLTKQPACGLCHRVVGNATCLKRHMKVHGHPWNTFDCSLYTVDFHSGRSGFSQQQEHDGFLTPCPDCGESMYMIRSAPLKPKNIDVSP
ncbi:hypothetical protein BV898_09855 [Hypsibius exemplaris]|uniref:Uncharacterized protein n=1 Tax=Hypsibius exemplaris TaxID=2072580 RepID=A0A1W0WL85_HYPEX|nr:hypothetical protein BV898_09855 [Hypsibius exemplaris]